MTHPTRRQPLAAGVASLSAPCVFAQPAWRTKPLTGVAAFPPSGCPSHHLPCKLFKLQSKTFIAHFPCRGAGPALQDRIASQVDLSFDGLGSSAAPIEGHGQLAASPCCGHRPARRGLSRSAHRCRGRRDHLQGVHLDRHLSAQGHAARSRQCQSDRHADGHKHRQADRHAYLHTPGAQRNRTQAQWTSPGTETPDLWGDDLCRSVVGKTKRWAEGVKTSAAKPD